ncbi:hypothetical protein EYF80_045208 [Liparis tanakae]|uniref:Uncharacterized protein n=1 Tax=Liparis tanakae TaxID=230148 RepID=A0A4Z2FTL8_9TELE|nr:hypothetical protein EYF80_045208 [Liparis tanakae]
MTTARNSGVTSGSRGQRRRPELLLRALRSPMRRGKPSPGLGDAFDTSATCDRRGGRRGKSTRSAAREFDGGRKDGGLFESK